MANEVILVAISLNGEDRPAIHGQVLEALKEMGAPGDDNVFGIECWWIAEDDRTEGSDNNSAVFVNPGAQYEAVQLLHSVSLTPACNLTQGTHGSPQGFDGTEI